MHTAARTVLTATLWPPYAVTNYFQLYPALGKQVGESATVYTNMPSAGAMRGYGIPQVPLRGVPDG